MSSRFVNPAIAAVPPSAIRRFFDIAGTMKDVISLGVGEPDFVTPDAIIRAGIRALEAGHTHYTNNSGTVELRQAICAYLERLYGIGGANRCERSRNVYDCCLAGAVDRQRDRFTR